MSVLMYGCTTRTLTKYLGKKLYGNCILSWNQHPIKQQLYGHLPLILQTIQDEHFWRSKDESVSDVHLSTSIREHTSVWPTSKNVHSSTLCRHWVPCRQLTEINGKKRSREFMLSACLNNDDDDFCPSLIT